MGLSDDVKKGALELSHKAMERIFADEKRATRIASAIGTVQRGKQALDRGGDELMRAFNFAPKGDFEKLGKQLSKLKRRLRTLDRKMDALHR